MGAFSTHFSNQELACHHCGVNECKQELVDSLESLREIIGLPINVHDAYRCSVHNASIPNAARNSQHQLGTAADISVKGMSAATLYRMALKVPAFYKGGIGVAIHQNYIHVDVREKIARWCYTNSGQVCLWDKSLDIQV